MVLLVVGEPREEWQRDGDLVVIGKGRLGKKPMVFVMARRRTDPRRIVLVALILRSVMT